MAAPESDTVGQRYYVCQSCGKNGADASVFKLIKINRVGFVICKDCWEE